MERMTRDGRAVAPHGGRGLRCAGIAVTLAVAACGTEPGDEPPNRLPVAALETSTPYLQIGETAAFDASQSVDEDGVIALYRFVFPDGSGALETTSAVASHAFVRSGAFEVSLTVVDDRGGQARATAFVDVTAAPPPPCDAHDDCRPGDVCIAGECRPKPCGPDVPCSPPLTCKMGECVPPTPGG